VKRLVVLAGLVVALAGAAACSSSTGGSGLPIPSTSGGAGTTSAASGGDSTTSSSASSGGTSLANTDPCSLLTASDASSVGLQAPGNPDNVAGERTCDYVGSQSTAIIGVSTDAGLSSFGNGTSVAVGSHQGLQDDQGTGGCQIAIGVSASSRVDVQVTPHSGSGCPEAMSLAKLIEPKLPQ
jgi:hypothetical protein